MNVDIYTYSGLPSSSFLIFMFVASLVLFLAHICVRVRHRRPRPPTQILTLGKIVLILPSSN